MAREARMYGYYVSKIKDYSAVDSLLEGEGIKRDRNLDYTCGLYSENDELIATGSAFGNTLRCFAVRNDHQGEGLLNEIVTHLVEFEASRGIKHLFVYTKASAADFFKDIGFYEIERVGYSFVFLENEKNGFKDYIEKLSGERYPGKNGAVVINANPFTNGHRYLLEKASSMCDTLHVFEVSEDRSVFPFEVRKHLIEEGTKDLKNLVFHDSGDYIISNSTFPSYFLKDEESVAKGHSLLDVSVFSTIAKSLGITERFAGSEKDNTVTGIYNKVMEEELPKLGVKFTIVERKTSGGVEISASTVRKAIKEGDWTLVEQLVPETTYMYLKSSESEPVIEKIKRADDVKHH